MATSKRFNSRSMHVSATRHVESSSSSEEEDKNGRNRRKRSGESPSPGVMSDTQSHFSTVTNIRLDEDEDDYMGTPFDASMDPNETRRILTDLIDQCQELDEKQGFQENEDQLIAEQVKNSKVVFETQFGKVAQTSYSMGPEGIFKVPSQKSNTSRMDEDEKVFRRKSEGLGHSYFHGDYHPQGADISLSQAQEQAVIREAHPSDMFLAYKHSKMCCGLMRKRTQQMGSDDSPFTVMAYLNALKKLGEDEYGNYSADKALDRIATEINSSMYTLPHIPSMYGSFDHKEFLAQEGIPAIPKVKDESKIRRGRMFDKIKVTAHEEVDESQQPKKNNKSNDESSNEFRKELANFCKAKGGQVKLHEFTVNKQSVIETLNNTFNLAFGVRDGGISLAKEGPDLYVAPCSVPQKSKIDLNTRRQCIVSFSAADLRRMQQMGEGENAIKPKTN